MKKYTIGIIIISLLFSISNKGLCQDVHFSQFYQTPLIVNPALTGVFSGDQRGIINYRNQWNDFAPYTTYSLSVDSRILKKKLKDKYFGAGLFLYHDEAGDTKLSTTQAHFSISSTIEIASNHSVSAGLQGGIAQRVLNGGTFKWGSQYDGYGFAPDKSGESAYFENYTFGDFSAGISWNFGKSETNISSNDYLGATAGFAVYHINAPKQGFDLENLNREFVIHGSAVIGMKGKPLALIPSIIYLQQGSLKEINIGGLLRLTLRQESKYTGFLKAVSAYGGIYYRVADALIPTILFEVANYALGFSYDMNVSPLTEASNGKGAFEISFRFINPDPFKHKGYNHRPLM
jgi:type IX secretion system PorP/SprF family membrane protein